MILIDYQKLDEAYLLDTEWEVHHVAGLLTESEGLGGDEPWCGDGGAFVPASETRWWWWPM